MPFSLEIKEKSSEFNSFTTKSGGIEQFLEFTKKTLIKTARAALKREQDAGFDKKPRVRVDNRFGKPISAVKPIGKIQYFTRVDASLALLRIYREIEKRSPRVSGQYVSGNRVIVNSREVARNEAELRAYLATGSLPADATIRFINVNPYARRLENKGIMRGIRGRNIGKILNKGEKKSISKKTGNPIIRPNGAYHSAFLFIRRNFRQLGRSIRFKYLPNGSAGISIPDLGPGFRNSFQTGKRGAIGRPYLYPSIVIKLEPSGISNV